VSRRGRLLALGFAGLCLVVAVAAIVVLATRKPAAEPGTPGSRTPPRVARPAAHPIDPRQQTALAFGATSHWLQPWRAYLDTPPAARLLAAPGIQLNVPPAQILGVARVLRRAGFRRVRVELGWSLMDPRNPARLRDAKAIALGARVLARVGLRPLVLLNGNAGAPVPLTRFRARLLRPVRAGDRTVLLDRRTAARIVPGRSGIDAPGQAAAVLFASIGPGGRATLALPAPIAVPAGRYPASTLAFEPFGRPRTKAGRPNPAFERTLAGWLAYAGAVTRTVRQGVGSDAFDVEIWNEGSFGSQFLDATRWWSPLPARLDGTGEVTDAILRRTVAYLRDPAHGVSGIGIGDGFANESPFPAGSTSPVGLTALDKHEYPGEKRFPGTPAARGARPLDSLGLADRPAFTPRYTAFFPEYPLAAIQTEHVVRDLSPFVTRIGAVAHGRTTRPPGGRPPALWVTETNVAPTARVAGGAEPRFRATVLLRTLAAYAGAGARAVYLYAAATDKWGLIRPAGFADAAAGRTPGRDDGGLALDALRRFLGPFRGGPAGPSPRRRLRLERVAIPSGHVQFRGDGTPNHPPLLDADVLAFFPFQVDAGRFAAAVYVMTRDLATPLAPETAELDLGGLDAARTRAALLDPMTGRRSPVAVAPGPAGRVRLRFAVTDAPRVLILRDR
jgi:hypothetical protein